jgi:hypothetical protein
MSKASNHNTFGTAEPLTRRGIVASIAAGLAVTAAIAVPAIASNASDDALFALIERHKAAQFALMKACRVSGDMFDDDPGYAEAEAITVAAHDEFDVAACALTDIVPATLGGAIALLSYIDEFNTGAFDNSEHELWPDALGTETIKRKSGRTLEMPFPYWVMRNVLVTLRKHAAV